MWKQPFMEVPINKAWRNELFLYLSSPFWENHSSPIVGAMCCFCL